MITPKGVRRSGGPRLVSLYSPYLVLTVVPLAALWLHALHSGAQALHGYYGLALLNGTFGGTLLLVTLAAEFRGLAASGLGRLAALRSQVTIVAAALFVVGLIALSASVSWHPMLQTLHP
jgi:hypothetical protein